MSNSEFLSQFKEEYQKLKQQRIEIDQKVKELLLQKMYENKTIIQELKKIGFIFTHPDNQNMQTKHGLIIGYNDNCLFVYCGEDEIDIFSVSKENDTPCISLDTEDDIEFTILADEYFWNNFIFSNYSNIAFVIHGLDDLKNQMTNSLKIYQQENEKCQQIFSTLLSR